MDVVCPRTGTLSLSTIAIPHTILQTKNDWSREHRIRSEVERHCCFSVMLQLGRGWTVMACHSEPADEALALAGEGGGRYLNERQRRHRDREKE